MSIDNWYIRGTVMTWDDKVIEVMPNVEGVKDAIRVNYSAFSYLSKILKKGMSLNMLDCKQTDGEFVPSVIVVEPDYLIDISSIAGCFKEYGHHPLSYTLNRMSQKVNSQAIILGNFAGAMLDDIVNGKSVFDMKQSLNSFFRRNILEFTSCPEFNAEKFKADAVIQAKNLLQVVMKLLEDYDAGKLILEPSFVCERLGVQGRVDLMTSDLKLLIEQKSGRNINIENKHPNSYGGFQQEGHFVQLLLYYGVLKYNFHLGQSNVDIRLLYSKYAPDDGLVDVSFLHTLFLEAMKLRNQIVATDYYMAEKGFDKVLARFTPDTMNVKKSDSSFYHIYQYPTLDKICSPLQHLDPLEKAYFCRMMTFIIEESRTSKTGVQDGMNGTVSGLWRMSVSEKIETGNIYTGLTVREWNSFCIIFDMNNEDTDFMPNFRRGDMIYLYAYRKDEVPSICESILYKGVINEIHSDRVEVLLSNTIPSLFCERMLQPDMCFAIEHTSSDIGTGASIRGLYGFITAPKDRKDLLLGRRLPKMSEDYTLSTHYSDDYDNIIRDVMRAEDYFLLVGPPGTGKTSMALQFMVREELTRPGASLLLMAYTNRAVDEICGMLDGAQLPFLRIGSKHTCDIRFHQYLLTEYMHDEPNMNVIVRKIQETPIIVATTATLSSKPNIFEIKHFSLAIIDEASQIIEPNIVGLLSMHTGHDKCAIDRFVLIGDHKQLPAVVQQPVEISSVDDELLKDINLLNCRDSLFERLLRFEHTSKAILRKQGRMHPDVATFPNEMFYAREQLLIVPCPHQLEEKLDYNEPSEDEMDELLKTKRFIYLESPDCRHTGVSDKVNYAEGKIVADLVKRLYRQMKEHFDSSKSIGIIVPYRNQIAVIRKEIEQLGIEELQGISIDTVERYQGSQRDVIIYSFTIQNEYQLDFLTANRFMEDDKIIDRKLNVALTRARKQMIIVGNRNVLEKDEIFSKLLEFSKK